MTKHSKGNWDVALNLLDTEKFAYAISAGDGLLAKVYKKRNWNGKESVDDMERTLANAKLMASAPKLLEELEHCVKALETIISFGATTKIIERAKSAINEAKGIDNGTTDDTSY